MVLGYDEIIMIERKGGFVIKRIGIIVGSLRAKSYSASLAKAVSLLIPVQVIVTRIDISDLPLFNPDDDTIDFRPDSYTCFREQVRQQDALIMMTPEYNRSMPAVLKNAIEIGSRPVDESVFNGKPVLIMSQSTGHLGGFGANHHLRQAMVFLNAIVMPQPEVYLSDVHSLIDKDGNLLKSDTKAFLEAVIHHFLDFSSRFVP